MLGKHVLLMQFTALGFNSFGTNTHCQQPPYQTEKQTDCFFNWLQLWLSIHTHTSACTRKHTLTLTCTETGIHAQTHSPLTVNPAVPALASILALRQRLLCFPVPASCDLCMCMCECVSMLPLICVGETREK